MQIWKALNECHIDHLDSLVFWLPGYPWKMLIHLTGQELPKQLQIPWNCFLIFKYSDTKPTLKLKKIFPVNIINLSRFSIELIFTINRRKEITPSTSCWKSFSGPSQAITKIALLYFNFWIHLLLLAN